jgi:UPF0042 nucleotide-binding protein
VTDDERTLVVVVTGLSGAGKSTAVHALEDVGFFCVDNLPTPGVEACLDALAQEGMRRIALGIDVRVRTFLEDAKKVLGAVQARDCELKVLFLDCSDQSLLRRYSSTRRPHPLSMTLVPGGERAASAVLEGIQIEREMLSTLRARASIIIDTTELSVHELRRRVSSLLGSADAARARMRCRFVSFGFKYGSPVDADLMLDVRFLNNPYFVPELKPMSGLEQPVREFVLGEKDAMQFIEHAAALLEFCMPRFETEGKSYVTVALGCTGGRHRSVVLTEHLAKLIRDALGLDIEVVHRDVDRTSKKGGRIASGGERNPRQ